MTGRLAGAALVGLLLSACAGDKVWMRSGASSHEAEVEEVDCAAEAEGGGIGVTVGGGAAPQFDRFSQRYACLRSRGYRLVPLSPDESARLKSLGGVEREVFWAALLAKNGFSAASPESAPTASRTAPAQ